MIVTHDIFKRFLMNPDDPIVAAEIESITNKEKNEVSCWNIIKKTHRIAGERIDLESANPYITNINDLDRMLCQVLSATISQTNAGRLLRTLYHSSLLYEHFCKSLSISYMIIASDEIPEMAGLKIATDKAILHVIRGISESRCKRLKFPMYPWDKLISWLPSLNHPKYWIPSFATAVILLFLLVWRPWFQNGQKLQQIYKQTVPYTFYSSGLRDGTSADGQNPDLFGFVYNYKLAMSDYVLGRYENVVLLLADTEKKYIEWINTATDAAQLAWIRDFYFYWGMSYLAIDRHQMNKRDELEQAIDRFKTAQSYIETSQSGNASREYYFLGLALALNGEKEGAKSSLNKVSPENRYHQQAQAIIQSF